MTGKGDLPFRMEYDPGRKCFENQCINVMVLIA